MISNRKKYWTDAAIATTTLIVVAIVAGLLITLSRHSFSTEDGFTVKSRKWRLDSDRSDYGPGAVLYSVIDNTQIEKPLCMIIWVKGDPPTVKISESSSANGAIHVDGVRYEALYPDKIIVCKGNGEYVVLDHNWELDVAFQLTEYDKLHLLKTLERNGILRGE